MGLVSWKEPPGSKEQPTPGGTQATRDTLGLSHTGHISVWQASEDVAAKDTSRTWEPKV